MAHQPPPLPAPDPRRSTEGNAEHGYASSAPADAPADESAPPSSTSAALHVRCRNCGAPAQWMPEDDSLSCSYCGTRAPVPRAEGVILERPLAAADEAARGFGVPRRGASCSNCGARVHFGEAQTAGRCPFCGSGNVIQQEASRNALRPESLVPLQVGSTAIEQSFRRWLHGLWLRPNALRHARVEHAVGIYVPYWLFDCAVHSAWSADAGHYYYVSVPHMTMVKGRPVMSMRRERRVRWVPAFGTREDAFDDLPVLASRGIPASLAEELGSFDLRALVPYRHEYLTGWTAEEYVIDLEQGWQRGEQAVAAIQRERCAGDVPGDTQRALRVQSTIRDVRWKHVLLPVWSLGYAHAGKRYTVLIHGQSGKVVGQAPYSWIKIALVALAVGASVALGIAFAELA
jgi:DNA-directed RNA polymerase subunit RPC12/RpoP